MNDKFVPATDFKIMSGGQTGADRAGLDWAIGHGFAHGGWCPKGRRSEEGTIDSGYLLLETPTANYLQRTEWNVRDSDVTLIFTLVEKLDGGSKRTADFAERLGRPWLHVHPRVHPKYVARFLAKHQVKCVNIAGKRESSAPGISAWLAGFLDSVVETPGS